MLMAFSVGNVWATLPASPTWEAQALADIADGSTIIIISNSTTATNIALPAAGAGTSNPPKKACTVTTNAGVTTITPPDGTTLQDLAWTVSKQTSSWKFYVEGSTTNCLYLTGTSSNTALRVGNGSSNNEFVMGDAGKLLKVTTAARFVGPNDNGGTDWRTYNTENASNYKGAQLTFYVLKAAPSCSNTVTITKGAETNGTYTLSATEICGDGEGEDVTISDITPAAGFAFDEITTSASGTVDNVNKKVTGITANTTITVKFKELQKYTVSFNTGAGNPAVSPITEATAGAGITLPAGPTPACSADGWTFAGWAAAVVGEETTTAPTLLSGNYNPTDNVTLYAVYKRTEEGGGVAFARYEKVTSNPSDWSGTYLLAANTSGTTYYTFTGMNGATAGASTELTPGTTEQTDYEVVVAKTTNGYSLYHTKGKVYLGLTSDGNNLNSNSSFTASNYEWTLSYNNGVQSVAYTARYIECNTSASYKVACYKASQKRFYLYKRIEEAASTTYYLSAPSCCTKHNIELVLGVQHGSISADLTSACEGTEVTLTATPDTHCAFVAWDVKQGETPVAVSDNKFTMPDGDVTVSATFAEIKNAVTFAAPTGGTLSIMNGEDPVSTDTEIVEGTALTVTATPDAENHYIGGTIKVVKTSDESDVTASVLDGSTLTMPNYAITVSATFTPTYAINLVAEGGSIALEYTKGGAADGYALAGTEIMATATADDAHVFTSLALSENVTIKDIDENVAMFTMPAEAVTVTATFDAKSTPTISVSTDAIAFDPVDYNGELAAQTFKVSGVALVAGKLTITSNNEAFSVSPAEIDVDGALDETEITVTPKTTACGTFNATITISSDNAAAKEVSVSLTVNKLASNLAWSATEATVTIDAKDNVFPTLTNPRNLPVVYSSLDDEVASIDENGAVTLKKAGETRIIVNFAGNDTVTALAEDALYYTLIVQQKYTVEWYINGAKKGYQTALAGVALENIPDATSIENGAIAGKVFIGWATAAIDGEVDEAPALLNPTVMPGADTKYYAVYAVETPGEAIIKTDELTLATTGVSGTSYSEWTGKTGVSGAVYAGNSAAGNDAIQMRAKTNSGIVTTATGTGKATKVTLTWNSNTAEGRSIAVYGKNSAYSGTSELYGDAKGTEIGSIAKGSTTLNITDEYDYIGLLAVGGALYLDKVEIEWSVAGEASYTKYATSGPRKLANPTFSVEAGTYTETKSIVLSAADGTIYFTLDGTEPTVENGRIYGDPIALKNYGSYTIKAIAAKEDGSKSDVVSATYGINIPFETVSALFDYIDGGKAFLGDISVTGVVSEIVTAYSTEHSNISFNISDDGQTTSNQFQSFRGVGTEASAITVGDQVTITGTYTLYGSIHELKQGNVISNRIAAEVTSVVISGTATKTEYFYNDDFSFAGLVATANYNTGYTKVVTEEANVWAADPAQVTATGNVNVTATYGGKTSDAKVVAVTKQLRQLDYSDLYWSSYDRENILLGYSETPAVRSVINKYNLPVTYRSGNGSVMSVNAETGVITAKAPGFASMFVEFAGNEEYAAHDASYPVAVFGYDHIELSGEAAKTAYEKGDAFEYAGLVATAVYTLGEQTPQQLVVTDLAEWSADPATIGRSTSKVAATASWKEKSASTDVDVTVNKHTITIEAPENGSLTVTDELPISSGDKFCKGDELTVTATPASADYKAGVVTVTGATLEGNTFTVGTSDITVSAVFAEKAAAEIGWSSSAPEVVLFGYSEAPAQRAVSNPHELSLSYRSSNTDAVTVNAETGEIAVVGTGSASIFVEFAGNADYKAISQSYTINVYGFDHIALSGEATKTAYEKGDAFEFTGLVATAVYTLEDAEDQNLAVTDLAEWSAEPATIGSNTAKVTATASWKEKNVSQEVDVTVNKHTITIEATENGSLAVVNELPVSSGEKFYKGDQLTVTATPASADYKAGVITVTGATLEGNTLTVGTTDFTVAATFAEKAVPAAEEFSWSTTAYTAYIGDELNIYPALTNALSLTVSYTSSNTEVATIDAEGQITILAEGETTISATSAMTADFKAQTVSYTLTVAQSTGQDTIYSYYGKGQKEAIEFGGTAKAEGGDAGIVVGTAQRGNYTIKLGKGFNNANFVGITLNKALKAGDKIAVASFITSSGKTAEFGMDFSADAASASTDVQKTFNVTQLLTESGEPNDTIIPVPEAADGAKYIRIYRNVGNTSIFVANFTIIRNGGEPTPTYAVTIEEPANGTLAINGITSGEKLEEGTNLKVVTAADQGYMLEAVKVVNTETTEDVTALVLNGTTLTVPDFAITVSATFVEVVEPTDSWAEIVFTEVANAGTWTDSVFHAPYSNFALKATTPTGKLSIDNNVATFGTEEEHTSYSYRFKTNGITSINNVVLALNIPVDGTLRFAVRTASNAATDRALVVIQDNDTILNYTVIESESKVDGYYRYIYVQVKAGTAYVETTSETTGGLNFYAFGFQAAKPTYSVSMAETTNGTLAVKYNDETITSGDQFIAGTVLTVVTTPSENYELDAITVKDLLDADVTEVVLNGTTLTVPDYAIVVSATFKAKGSGTALDNTEADTKAVKTMENGVLIIRRGDKTYNGQGQLLR